jgi:bacterial/archaeal transporter family protein
MKNMNWLIFALIAIGGYALFNFFLMFSADKISAPIGVAIIGSMTVVVALIAIISMNISGQEFLITSDGIKFAILAGLFTAIAELAYYIMYLKGTNLSIGTPLVVGGTILIATILGVIILSETLSIVKIIGVITTIVGIILLSM